jgi:DNA-binding NarL/FixJ family response regulator
MVRVRRAREDCPHSGQRPHRRRPCALQVDGAARARALRMDGRRRGRRRRRRPERRAHAEPDVVLLDVGLPDMSGLEVARRLRDGSPRVAVVVVSTQDSADYRELALANGARGFFPKAELTGAALDALVQD